MTRERHIAIIRRYGNVDAEVASKIVDRFLDEVEMERFENPSQEVAELKRRPDVDKLSPPLMGENPSIQACTDGAEASPKMLHPVEVTEAITHNKYWSEFDLSAHLEAVIPSVIQVAVEGRTEPVELCRSIDPMIGIDLVKVIFSQRDANKPTPSARNLNGDVLDAMTIDCAVSETFSCYEKVPSVDLKLGKIRASARMAFRPRPERIVSTTRRNMGESLSFNEDTPHDTV